MSVIIHKTVIKNNTYFTVSIGENNLRCLTRWYPSHLDLLSQAPLRLSYQAPENPPNSMKVSSQSLVLSSANVAPCLTLVFFNNPAALDCLASVSNHFRQKETARDFDDQRWFVVRTPPPVKRCASVKIIPEQSLDLVWYLSFCYCIVFKYWTINGRNNRLFVTDVLS